MAGSAMAFTYDKGPGPIKRVIATWTSDDTAGTASGSTTNKIVGRIVKAITNPGTAAPTANYDITVSDEQSVNVLTACDDDLQNRHTSNTEETYFFALDTDATPLAKAVHPAVCSTLTVAVANAGNSKEGVLILFVEGEIVGSA